MKNHPFSRTLRWLLLPAGVLLAAVCYLYERDYEGYFQERRGTFATATISPAGSTPLFDKSWLSVKNTDGFAVECGMLTPRERGRRYPAIILLGGKATGKYAVDYAMDIDHVLIVAVDYPYTPRETYTMFTFLTDVPAIRAALIDMVPSVMLLTDYLLTRDDVDSQKIVLLGYSFGAPFIPCIIANDRRAAVAAMVYGGGDLRSMIVHNVRRYENEVVSQCVGSLGGLLLHALEPMRYIRRVAPIPLIMINGTGDEQIPRANAELLYGAAGEPKSLTWLDSRHVRPDNKELTRAIVGELKRGLANAGIPLR